MLGVRTLLVTLNIGNKDSRTLVERTERTREVGRVKLDGVATSDFGSSLTVESLATDAHVFGSPVLDRNLGGNLSGDTEKRSLVWIELYDVSVPLLINHATLFELGG